MRFESPCRLSAIYSDNKSNQIKSGYVQNVQLCTCVNSSLLPQFLLTLCLRNPKEKPTLEEKLRQIVTPFRVTLWRTKHQIKTNPSNNLLWRRLLTTVTCFQSIKAVEGLVQLSYHNYNFTVLNTLQPQ